MKDFFNMNAAEQERAYQTEITITLVCGEVLNSICNGIMYTHQIAESQRGNENSEFVYVEMDTSGIEIMGIRRKDISRVRTKFVKKLEVMDQIGTDEL